jgi:hypothetical protein
MMGATKLNIKHVREINTAELTIDEFAMDCDENCTFIVDHEVQPGEVVLIKASFKNACDCGADNEALFRRRVIPLLTRVAKADRVNGNGHFRVCSTIENMTEDDRVFFFKKYFEPDDTVPLELELEGKHIRFAPV